MPGLALPEALSGVQTHRLSLPVGRGRKVKLSFFICLGFEGAAGDSQAEPQWPAAPWTCSISSMVSQTRLALKIVAKKGVTLE